jgi:hypothetical protein
VAPPPSAPITVRVSKDWCPCWPASIPCIHNLCVHVHACAKHTPACSPSSHGTPLHLPPCGVTAGTAGRSAMQGHCNPTQLPHAHTAARGTTVLLCQQQQPRLPIRPQQQCVQDTHTGQLYRAHMGMSCRPSRCSTDCRRTRCGDALPAADDSTVWSTPTAASCVGASLGRHTETRACTSTCWQITPANTHAGPASSGGTCRTCSHRKGQGGKHLPPELMATGHEARNALWKAVNRFNEGVLPDPSHLSCQNDPLPTHW